MVEPAVLAPSDQARGSVHEHRRGLMLVATAALLWSSGGLIVRSLEVADTWTTVFWRSATALAFLLLFLFWRDGRRAPGLILRMGWPGLVVAACYAAASIALVVALNLTTVANVLVIMSTAPFLSALFGWMVLGERVSVVGCLAILASIAGVAIMVSDSYGHGSVLGDLIALSIALSQAVAIVVIRGHRTVRMTPAMALATLIAAIVALPAANPFEVTRWDFVLLCLFGAAQLGLGLALFSYGAPLVPAAEAALLNVLEPILGPVWVWLVLSERPSGQALVGAGIVLAALMLHLAVGLGRKRRTDDAHAR